MGTPHRQALAPNQTVEPEAESQAKTKDGHRTLITYLAAYFFAIGAAIRYLSTFRGHPSQWTIAGLLAAFLTLMSIEPWLTRRSFWYTHLYLAVQTGIIIALSLTTPSADFFSLLFISLTLQAMHVFPPRIGFRWVGLFTVVMAVLMIGGSGWGMGLPLVLINVVAYFFIASYVAVIRRLETARREAETARQESQTLLAELQEAHRELQVYAAQVEELAAVEERNRLARELHDSVTQTIFSMTLTAEATRILLERDPTKTGAQIDRLLELAQSALAEMRSLISHLRPKTVAEEGLILALRRHVAERGDRDRLTVALRLEGYEEDRRLPPEIEEALFRIVQEALNNVAKHAQTDRAEIRLHLGDELVSLLVEDPGVGFDPSRVSSGASHLGLTSMRERVRALGGTLEIESQPGAGTRIKVEVPLAEEERGD
jgi:signal transduction histidine kinase